MQKASGFLTDHFVDIHHFGDILSNYTPLHPLPFKDIGNFLRTFGVYLCEKGDPWSDPSQKIFRAFRDKYYRIKQDEVEHLIEVLNTLETLDESASFKRSYKEKSGVILNILAQIKKMAKARFDFIEQNFSIVDFLYRQGFYYDFDKNTYVRYSLLSPEKPWVDLLSSDRYFQYPPTWLEENAALIKKSGETETTTHGVIEDISKENAHLLPTPDYVNKEDSLVKLATLITLYHAEPKTTYQSIAKRIIFLEDIEKSAQALQPFYPESIALKAMITTTSLKRNYLKKLRLDMQQREREIFAIPQTDDELLFILGPSPVRSMKKFWDRSVEDPYDRRQSLPPIFLEDVNTWNMEQGASENKYAIDKSVTFQEGIGFTPVLNVGLLKGTIRKMETPPEETQQLNLSGEDQRVADGVYIFAIDEGGKLFILPNTRGVIKVSTLDKLSQNLLIKGAHIGTNPTHDRLLGGKNVLLAGELRFTNGKITEINPGSGHYAPRKSQLLYGLRALLIKNPGAFDLNTLSIKDFEGRPIPLKDLSVLAKIEDKRTLKSFDPTSLKILDEDTAYQLKKDALEQRDNDASLYAYG